MPPRYAYWTILIDQKPTAFRAREREELLPTFHQLKRKNTDVVMKWFARGRLWESPEEAQAAQRAPKPPLEKRGRDWRPGGEHRDPRERFKKRSQPPSASPEPWRPREKPDVRSPSRPWSAKPKSGPPRPTGKPSWRDRPRKPKSGVAQVFRPARKNPWQRDRPGGSDQRKRWSPARREAEEPTRRKPETPSSPPAAEKIVTKPKPPEND